MTTLIRKAIYTREDEDALVQGGEEWNFHEDGGLFWMAIQNE
jgi:hypothetical protein